MDIWFKWCQKPGGATCNWCEKTIERATPMVVTRLWRKGDENSRRWNITKYYHPECYLAQGLDYLERNPFSSKVGGSKKMELKPYARKYRLKLLRKKASLVQRKQRLKIPYPDRVLYEARIDEQIAGLAAQIATVGGIPKSWLSSL